MNSTLLNMLVSSAVLAVMLLLSAQSQASVMPGRLLLQCEPEPVARHNKCARSACLADPDGNYGTLGCSVLGSSGGKVIGLFCSSERNEYSL